MKRIIAIGDIHGEFNLLINLINKLKNNFNLSKKHDKIIFLGDYIDRGGKSFDVINFLIEFEKEYKNVIFLKGNHEQMFLNYLAQISQDDIGLFLYNGGYQTLDNYKKHGYLINSASDIPKSHLTFYHSLKSIYKTKDYIFVHAGINPYFKDNENSHLWIRDEFINSKVDFGKLVIFGHTIYEKPLIHKNKIGIDTGAFYHGKLTAVILPEIKFVYTTKTKRTKLTRHIN